ncbi:cysteine rich repeat-containing protein [Ancylobacter pratisalsi]|uniref:Cysteine rich repeat protein n=1 Tax=Ancylobacter pratisalsi TaxID=1745854 RepID=A0A6P1YQ05_9HYPH|nr:cysteine rich repeat-containing protein [Ancylobacter pratisalsi]QIB35202.1 hypothetical protein G3A50_16910 [Ancylobacter pratisalsi]
MLRKLNRRAAIVIILAGIAGAVFAHGALAQTPAAVQNLTPAQIQNLRAACAADIQTYCAGVQPGGGRVLQCIKTNAENMSPPCVNALLSVRSAQAQ